MIKHSHCLRLVDRQSYILRACRYRSVLHLGCMSAPNTKARVDAGTLLHTHLHAVASSLIGMDCSTADRNLLPPESDAHTIIQADVQTVPTFPNAEIVLVGEILEHLPNPGLLLARLAKQMPNAELIVTVPNALRTANHDAAKTGVETVHSDHVAWYSPTTLVNLLQATGWHTNDLIAYGNEPGNGRGNIAAPGMIAAATTTPKPREENPVPVWTYWEGPKPGWIELCLETIEANIPDVTILTPKTWADIYDGIIPRKLFNKQFPNVKSDYIRAWLLRSFGGIWIDADAIVYRDVRPIWTRLKKCDFVAYRVQAPAPQICSALIAADQSSTIGHTYLSLMERKMLNHARRLPKLALGPRILGRAVRTHKDKDLALIPTERVHPIHWQRKAILQRPANGWAPHPEAYCTMLTHRALGPLRSLSAPDLLKTDTLAAQLYGIASRCTN